MNKLVSVMSINGSAWFVRGYGVRYYNPTATSAKRLARLVNAGPHRPQVNSNGWQVVTRLPALKALPFEAGQGAEA